MNVKGNDLCKASNASDKYANLVKRCKSRRSDDGGSTVLRIVGILQHCMASQLRRPRLGTSDSYIHPFIHSSIHRYIHHTYIRT